MTAEETVQNFVTMIQVPLRPKRTRPRFYSPYLDAEEDGPVFRGACVARPGVARPLRVEHAIIGTSGDRVQAFDDAATKVTRDTRYPIRATICFYKVTSDGEATPDMFPEIAAQHAQIYKKATSRGSLVTTLDSGRVTEPIIPLIRGESEVFMADVVQAAKMFF